MNQGFGARLFSLRASGGRNRRPSIRLLGKSTAKLAKYIHKRKFQSLFEEKVTVTCSFQLLFNKKLS